MEMVEGGGGGMKDIWSQISLSKRSFRRGFRTYSECALGTDK